MTDWREHAQQIMALQDAGQDYPTGTFWQRWIPGVCKHERVRCIHGDEIIARRFRRRLCMVCGRSLKGPLPERCFYSPTNEAHSSV